MSINRSAIQLLEQLGSVVNQLKDQQFRQPVDTLSQASIGQHVRHTLEFFLCLLDAKNLGTINYDNRKHDKVIEEDAALAASVIKSIKSFVEKETEDFPLTLEANYEMEDEELVKIPSSFMRELAYNIEHAIHHMALIKIGLQVSCPDIKLPEHFGVASSTVRYKKSQH